MKDKDLNLLNPLESPKGFWEDMYFWVSLVGRYIVIGISIFVIVVFIGRIALNTILVNSNNKITSEVSQLHSTYQTQTKAENMLTYVNSLATVNRLKTTKSGFVQEFFSTIPANSSIFISSTIITNTNISINGVADNYQDLQSFNDAYLQSAYYKNVQLTTLIKSSNQYGINFTLTADYSVPQGPTISSKSTSQ